MNRGQHCEGGTFRLQPYKIFKFSIELNEEKS
jgi:hypothetical protein